MNQSILVALRMKKPVRIGSCFALLCLLSSAAIPRLFADDLFGIDFEDKDHAVGKLSETMPHNPGNFGTFQWQVTQGAAEVQTNVVHGGEQALRLGSNRCAIRQRFYNSKDCIQLPPKAVYYYDFWIYPDCEPSDLIVVARLIDIPNQSTYADIHFANGVIKVLTKPENEAKPKYVEVAGEWESRKWNRVTLKIDGAAQKLELFLDGKPCMKSPLPLPQKFSGVFSGVSFEGPAAKEEWASCYYDDLGWSDANPLAAK